MSIIFFSCSIVLLIRTVCEVPRVFQGITHHSSPTSVAGYAIHEPGRQLARTGAAAERERVRTTWR